MRIGRFLIFLVFVLGVSFLAYDFSRPSYPIYRMLENKEGKTIRGLIQGKEEGTMYFDLDSTGVRYPIEISSLSLKDQIYAFRLRESSPPPLAVPEEKEPEDRYIAIRREEIEKLKIKERVIKDEIDSMTLNELLHQNRLDQITKVQEEIRALELAIKTYNYRMKKE